MLGLRFVKILSAFFLIWVSAFAYFVINIPNEKDNIIRHTDNATDAVIVLTGGPKRVQEGLAIFNADKSKKFLISGTGVGVTTKDIINTLDAENIDLYQDFNDNKDIFLVLGSIATSTFTNAYESKLFLDLNNCHSATIVTSNYHIPRSKMVFQHIMPGYKIAYHPVYTHNILDAGNINMILLEYHKFIITFLIIAHEKYTSWWDECVHYIYNLLIL